MEICSRSLQTGRLCERMQSLGDGLSGSVYWHALIWHWVKGMSHRLQTHYHITATPANMEAAPGIRVELHQRSLIQLPRATRSNKPCLHCLLAGWRGDGALEIKGHVCRCSDLQHAHTQAHTHTSTGTSVSISLKSHQPSSLTALQNISIYTNDFNLNLESKLVLASWMDDWAWWWRMRNTKGLLIKQMAGQIVLGHVTTKRLLSVKPS